MNVVSGISWLKRFHEPIFPQPPSKISKNNSNDAHADVILYQQLSVGILFFGSSDDGSIFRFPRLYPKDSFFHI